MHLQNNLGMSGMSGLSGQGDPAFDFAQNTNGNGDANYWTNATIGTFPTDYPLTIQCWVKGTVTGTGAGYFFDYAASGTDYIRIGTYGSANADANKPLAVWNFDGDGVQVYAPSANINDNAWHHVMLVLKAAGGDIQFIIDGSAKAVGVLTASYLGDPTKVLRLMRPSPAGFPWVGSLDEVIIWGSDESAKASDLYNSGTGIVGSTLPAGVGTPAIHYGLNHLHYGGAGYDYIDNANNVLTKVGSPTFATGIPAGNS